MGVCVCVAGTFQSAGVIQSAYNLNNELRVLPVLAPANCLHDSCVFVTVSSPAVIVETLKQVIIAILAEFTVYVSVHGHVLFISVRWPCGVCGYQRLYHRHHMMYVHEICKRYSFTDKILGLFRKIWSSVLLFVFHKCELSQICRICLIDTFFRIHRIVLEYENCSI